MAVESKRELGQYFTKDEIWLRPHIKEHLISLQENYSRCVDPFAGDGHLLDVAETFGYKTIGHDIDEGICVKNGWGKPNDSLMKVIRHDDAFVLTNPPYLAKNSAKRMKSEMASYFQPGAIPGIDIGMLGVLDDLFKFAIEKVMQTYSESIWIVPEAGIQDLEDLNHWMKNLHSVTILEQNPFDDTEHPVCVMIFSRSNPKQEIWKNDDLLGKYVDIKNIHDKFSKGPSRSTPMKFNSPEGRLGFRAVDGTREDGSMRIKFCRGEELGYPRENIKVSSRHLTYIDIEIDGDVLDATIAKANKTIDEYRDATHDVFLTAFMGNTNTGERRRRLDYKLARTIFNKAFKNQQLRHSNKKDPFYKDTIDEALIRLRKENLTEVRLAAETKEGWLMKKIRKELDRWGEDDEEEEIRRILSDYEIAKKYSKDPTKQTFHQKHGQKEMKKSGLNIQHLPHAGVEAIYVHGGEIKTGLSRPPEARIKSIDCKRIKDGWTDYILQKYTGEGGGSQDGTFGEVQTFVMQAVLYTNVEETTSDRFIALVDGEYYTKEKIKELNDSIPQMNKDRVKVLSTFEYINL